MKIKDDDGVFFVKKENLYVQKVFWKNIAYHLSNEKDRHENMYGYFLEIIFPIFYSTINYIIH